MAPDGEVRASRWHVLRVHLGLLFVAALCGLVWIPEILGFAKPGETPRPITAVLIVAGVWLWTLYSAVAVVVNRVRLTPDWAERRTVFGERGVKRSDVLGQRPSDDGILLCTDLKRRDGLEVPKAVTQHPVWAAWLHTLPNLDQQDLIDQQASEDADPTLGRNTAERRARVTLVGRVDGVFSLALIAVLLWVFIRPVPYELAIALAAATPLIAIGAMWFWRPLRRGGGAVGGVALGAVILSCRAMLDLQLLDLWSLGLIAGAAALVAVVFTVRFAEAQTAWAGAVVGVLVGLLAFGWVWSVLAFADVLLDDASPRTVRAMVLTREDQDGDAKFVLREAAAPQEVFKGVSAKAGRVPWARPGAMVCLTVHPGRLGWRWGHIEACSAAEAS